MRKRARKMNKKTVARLLVEVVVLLVVVTGTASGRVEAKGHAEQLTPHNPALKVSSPLGQHLRPAPQEGRIRLH